MAEERIEILKNILVDLHHGASQESVQERFNQHFQGVSALEISLMEHELMSDEKSGVTFEDVMELCDVHANLFKNAVQGVEVADSDQPGHPVYVFKQENLALRGALLRIRRILDNLAQPEIMESYGHDSPPRVMWGVDDEIRQLFKDLQAKVQDLPEVELAVVKESFEVFADEFEQMIFKEESILLMILLEIFTQDDWLKIAKESQAIGYAIVKPEKEWIPQREKFEPCSDLDSEDSQAKAGASLEPKASKKSEPTTGQGSLDWASSQKREQVIETPAGQFTISFEPKKESLNRQEPQQFTNGYLSLDQANLILDHLPLEITFVNKDDIFQYYNNSVPAKEMIFKRMPSQIGRNVELCHPPRVLDKVKQVFEVLKSGQKDKVTMWFKSQKKGKFVYVTYAAVRDQAGEFQGVLEYVQDIQPFFDLEEDSHRDIT